MGWTGTIVQGAFRGRPMNRKGARRAAQSGWRQIGNGYMSCWVVPAVAAEFWGIPVDAVLARVREGQVSHKTEQGFLFVDVAPWSVDFVTARPSGPPPPTFVAVAADETSSAFNEQPTEIAAAEGEESAGDDEEGLLASLSDEETESFSRLSWQEVRRTVGRTRKPPIAAAA